MKAITIEHLSCYLPYGLTFKHPECEAYCIICGINTHSKSILNIVGQSTFKIEEIKPILRPISDLFNDKLRPVPINELKSIYGWDYLFYNVYKKKEAFNVMALQYGCLQKLFEHKFDVFGLIEKGLAIDINTIKPLK